MTEKINHNSKCKDLTRADLQPSKIFKKQTITLNCITFLLSCALLIFLPPQEHQQGTIGPITISVSVAALIGRGVRRFGKGSGAVVSARGRGRWALELAKRSRSNSPLSSAQNRGGSEQEKTSATNSASTSNTPLENDHANQERSRGTTNEQTNHAQGPRISNDQGVPDEQGERAKSQEKPAIKPITEILLTNVISILSDGRRKFTKYAFERSGADILILTETNLNESVLNGTIQIPGYKLVSRSDRIVHPNHVSRTVTKTQTKDDQVELMP